MATYMDTEKKTYCSKLSGDTKARYNKKIQECGGIDPYELRANDLSTNPRDFPEITMYDIGDYMIHSVSPFTKRFLDNYKGTEAYRHFESGFVVDVGSKKNDKTAIVKGRVRHSQRMNESLLQVWILANLDGKIICGHCTCVAGLSETCSHIGAVCFAINKIAESRETKSVTDVLCQWNVPSHKKVTMSAGKDVTWRFPSHERSTIESSFLEYCDTFTNLSDATIDQFILTCNSTGDDTALETITFPSKKKRKTKIRDEIFLASWYNENYKNETLHELVKIGKSISLEITNAEVNEISAITLPRLKSKCYLGLRRGRISGSNFKNCCVTDIKDPSFTTIRRIISPIKTVDHLPSIKYQMQNKKKAIKQFNATAASSHEDFVYNECGLIINPNMPYLVGSHDGIISCACHGNGCIEIKCLNIQEPEALDEFLTRKPNNIMNKSADEYSLERNNAFFYQVQLEMNLSDLKYCDCVIWSPQKAFSVRVYVDIDFWNVAIQKALRFHEQVIVPELLGKFYTNKIELPYSSEDDEEELELIKLEIELLGS